MTAEGLELKGWDTTYKEMRVWKKPYVLSGEFAFYMHDTLGFPIELLTELLRLVNWEDGTVGEKHITLTDMKKEVK